MNLGTLTNATAELLLYGLVAGFVLTGLTWLLIRTLRNLTAVTTYLMLYLTLVAIVLVPIFRALPDIPSSRQGTPNTVSDLPEALTATNEGPTTRPTPATAEGPAAQAAPALEPSTAASSPPAPSPAATALEGSASVEPTPPRALASLPRISSVRVPASWLTVISGLFLVGFLYMAVRLFRGYLLLRRCRARSLPASDQHQLLLKGLKERMGVKRTVQLRTSKELSVPMAAGLIRPVIFLPETLTRQVSEDELGQILLHELAHLARRDDWTQLGQRLTQALLFFHPAVHWLSRRLNLERELACDDWVVSKQGGVRKRYAACLLKVASLNLEPTLPAVEGSAVMFRSSIERRIQLLSDGTRTISDRVSRGLLVACLGILVVAGFGVVQLSPALAAAAKTAEQHIVDGNVTLGESSTQADIDALAGVTEITGDLVIERLGFEPDLSPFDDLKVVGGSIRILINRDLTSIGGFNSLETMAQNDACFGQCIFEITRNLNLTSIDGFNKLATTGGPFTITSNGALTSIGGFDSLASVEGNVEIARNNALPSIGGFDSLASIGGEFVISENNALASIGGFASLETIVERINIARNNALTSIGGFDSLQTVYQFEVEDNASLTSISGFDSLQTANDFLIGDDGTFELVWFDNPLLASIDGFYNLAWETAVYWHVQDVTYLCPSFGLTTAANPSCVEP